MSPLEKSRPKVAEALPSAGRFLTGLTKRLCRVQYQDSLLDVGSKQMVQTQLYKNKLNVSRVALWGRLFFLRSYL